LEITTIRVFHNERSADEANLSRELTKTSQESLAIF